MNEAEAEVLHQLARVKTFAIHAGWLRLAKDGDGPTTEALETIATDAGAELARRLAEVDPGDRIEAVAVLLSSLLFTMLETERDRWRQRLAPFVPSLS